MTVVHNYVYTVVYTQRGCRTLKLIHIPCYQSASLLESTAWYP